ncbi:cobalt transporter CbiM [Seleniivibrio woodruffii]|uniref:Cobalt/nickel transport system permease protein n=1 Tax=Seleniivibrio woodruffii TaxID=1078050 RepID=A0A4R1KBZ6_9BACT|nr:cobalt transporter CbiM [Seleniivibrio woodruffii]TCK62056.1 cobalt/nickel transport system permease protein [Seleniivibrio woodruffii]TVZ34827.1 cobalt/nickel transport system permease protein [Seleniivibrio woodruffii]
MHISEGVLSVPVLVATGTAGAVLTVYGFYRMKADMMARTALMSSLFFVGSFIHIPVGPASVHLVLNGLVGAVLGFCAFPAILIALVLQALLFQFGGFTTLGTNVLVMALPALAGYFLFALGSKSSGRMRWLLYYLTGAVPVLLSAALLSAVLAFSGSRLYDTAKAIFLMNIPVVVTEGLVSMYLFNFLNKVYPDFLSKNHEN